MSILLMAIVMGLWTAFRLLARPVARRELAIVQEYR